MEIQWSLVLFTIISGMGACMFAFAVLQALLKKGPMPGKAETVVAFVLVAVGGCISATHIIYHLDRIVNALSNPTSGIFTEAAFVGVLCVLLAVYFIMLVRKSSEGGRKVLAIIIAIAGVVFAFACGNSYNMGSARPAWASYAVPVAYCASAIAAGGALNLFMKFVLKQKDAAAYAGFLAVIGGCVGLVGCAIFGLGDVSWATDADNGALTWLVLMLVLEVATVVCAALAWKKPKQLAGAATMTLAFGFVGGVGMRIFMWLVGTQLLNFFLMPLS